MDFFYREKPWYAGQFVRKIIPKIEFSRNAILYFTVVLNKLKHSLLSVLVRDVDRKFLSAKVNLPISNDGNIDFKFIDDFITEIETERLTELKAYLTVTGLDDYTLTDEEQKLIDNFDDLNFNEFKVVDVFNVKNSGNILSRDIVVDSGSTPYLCASTDNNAVSSYISYDKKYLDKGNCIFIGGKTFVVTYQEKDFYSNDSHNLILHIKEAGAKDKQSQLYLATCINKSLGHKYTWGDSISNKKIQKDMVSLPVQDNEVNYSIMSTFISAIEKLVIKDVVLYANRKTGAVKANK